MAQAKRISKTAAIQGQAVEPARASADRPGWQICDQYRVNQPHDRISQKVGRG